MRKSRIILLVLAVVLLAAVFAAAFLYLNQRDRLEADHTAVYSQYMQLLYNAQGSTLTVTEDGVKTGVYTLEDLGLWEDVQSSLNALYSETDRMEPSAFSALSTAERKAWSQEIHPQVTALAVPADHLNTEAVLSDLNRQPREAPQNAEVRFEEGAFQIIPEVSGNAISEEKLEDLLWSCASSLEINRKGPSVLTLELAESGCYQQPEVTVETGSFDFAALLSERLARMSLTLEFHGESQALPLDTLSSLVQVNEDGVLEIQPALSGFLVTYAESHRMENQPYRFDSYSSGPVDLDFLICDYVVDTEALGEALTEALLNLQSGAIQVPTLCTDESGQLFDIAGTYVEVDIANQQMTYYKDGELLVHTDVVTGFRHWRDTPTGYYTVENKDTDCWLDGPDFNVFVKYWVGFIGTLYGLHDASWRTEFGGDLYTRDGSHGCVNTPEDAMAVIYENIDVGTPVLVFDTSE